MLTLNCKGKIISLEKPIIMGILNVTPDSFFEGHLHDSEEDIIKLVGQMLEDGAVMIDIGGQSTRPGSERISVEEELKRVIPVIKSIRSHFPDAIISIDTYYAKVAEMAVEAGATLVNDISAGEFDKEMIPVLGKLQVPYILSLIHI